MKHLPYEKVGSLRFWLIDFMLPAASSSIQFVTKLFRFIVKLLADKCKNYAVFTLSLGTSRAKRLHRVWVLLLKDAADAGCHMCGVCTIPGWQGGLALLSNLERSPMDRIMLRGLPAQGGFEAAYYGSSFCK